MDPFPKSGQQSFRNRNHGSLPRRLVAECIHLRAHSTTKNPVTHKSGLLRVPLGQFGGHRRQVSEESTGSVIGAGGEVHLCSRRCRGIGIAWTHIPRTECPDTIDGQRISACILKQSFELSRGEIVSSDESTRL